MHQPRIGYAGFGAYLPDTVVTNDDLARVVDTTDEWIRRRTGIRTRRILRRGRSALDMAVMAARRALEDAGVAADEIGDIRVGVNTWMRFPSLATQLQDALGARHAGAADVSAGCAGFVYAVEEAYNKVFVEKVRHRRDVVALVVGVDAMSHITDWSDRETCVLLGDGAGAVVVRQVERGGILATHTHAAGQYGNALYSDRPYLRMDGRKVFAVAVETMVNDVRALLEKHNETSGERLTVDDLDYIYPHQANLRIIEMVAKRLEVPLEKVYTDGVVHYGNTSTASIPLGYCDNRERFEEGGLEADVAFGAGFASGGILRRTD